MLPTIKRYVHHSRGGISIVPRGEARPERRAGAAVFVGHGGYHVLDQFFAAPVDGAGASAARSK